MTRLRTPRRVLYDNLLAAYRILSSAKKRGYKMKSKQKVVCLDMDEVIYDSNCIQQVCEKYEIPFSSCVAWDLGNLPKEVLSEIHQMWREPKYMCDDSRFIRGATNFVRKLRELGFIVYIVTSSFSEITEYRRNHVMRMFGRGVEVRFTTTENKTKFQICKELGAMVLVDDRVENLSGFVGQNKIVPILWSNNGTPWNRKDPRSEQFIKCKNYTELLNVIVELENTFRIATADVLDKEKEKTEFFVRANEELFCKIRDLNLCGGPQGIVQNDQFLKLGDVLGYLREHDRSMPPELLSEIKNYMRDQWRKRNGGSQ